MNKVDGKEFVSLPLHPVGNPNYQQTIQEGLFSPKECRRTINAVRDSTWHQASITDETYGQRLNADTRSVSANLVSFDPSWPWRRLVEAIRQINDDNFRYELVGIPAFDRPSVLRYDAQSADHFRPHSDAGPVNSTRKLTYIVQLSPSSDYRGGDLMMNETGQHISREIGTLIVFPSTLRHVVTPIISGVRHVLVGWVHGPTIR